MRILHVDSSITGDRSVTRELSALIVRRLGGDGGGNAVTYRDLAADPLAHLTPAVAPAAHFLSEAAPASPGRAASDDVLAEFLAADTVVLGVPMYNFTLPSSLKSWIDRIVVPGTTFKRGENGPEGLAGGKRVILAVARGGFYGRESAYFAAEHAESFLRTVFGFIGVTDVSVVVAEGLSLLDDAGRGAAIAAAREEVGALAA